MSLYIDVKYVSLIAGRLRNFKRKDTNLWNCSCPICLDSASNKTKARGYIYMREQALYYMCHNCNYSKPIGPFIEQVDPMLYGEYRLEKWRDKMAGTVVRKPKEEKVEEEEPQEAFKTSTADRLRRKVVTPEPTLLDRMMDRLDTLPGDHEAVEYVRGRGIPEDQWHKMYFIPRVKDIVQLNPKYEERIKNSEPRIVLPFFDTKGQLSGVTCRAIRGESLRYVVVKVKDGVPLIFGINDMDRSKRIYVVEGPIDSMFVPNAIAAGGTGMGKIRSLMLPDDKVIIFDNQPRNKEVCDIIERNIDAGHRVVIWNQRITQKDINEMALDGVDYMTEINSRVFRGLQAKLEFNSWKKC